jgi:ribosomal protein S18 acetylase RimI-like enzyme
MTIEIRPITLADIPIVEQLAYDYNYELDPQATTQDAVVRWIAAVAQAALVGRHFFWLAWAGEQIVGFVSFQMRANPFTQQTHGFIEDLYIASPFRRRGYAEELARAAFAEISGHGTCEIQLEVLANNQQALAFWQKLGLGIRHHVLAMPVQANLEGSDAPPNAKEMTYE